MPDIHSIIVQIKPDVDQGMARVDSRLAQAEAKGKAAGEAIGEAFERAAQEALAAVEKSAAAQERAAAQAAKAAAKAAKEQAAAARQAAKEIDETARATIIAAERRARERSAAEREAAKQTAAAARQAAAAKDAADRQAAAAAKAAADAQKQAQAKLRDAYREIIGPAADYNRKLQEAIALERQGAIEAPQGVTKRQQPGRDRVGPQRARPQPPAQPVPPRHALARSLDGTNQRGCDRQVGERGHGLNTDRTATSSRPTSRPASQPLDRHAVAVHHLDTALDQLGEDLVQHGQ